MHFRDHHLEPFRFKATLTAAPFGGFLFRVIRFTTLPFSRLHSIRPVTQTLPSPQERAAIRREMRERRRSLSPQAQERASRSLARLLQVQPLFIRSRRVAFYLASDGEIDPRHLLQSALSRNKFCFLPVLHPVRPGRLWFRRIKHDSTLSPNRFGIAEPTSGRLIPGQGLDVVFMPLVAFDRDGGRLGMGAGFYDRSFAFKTQSKRLSPLLVGLAHSCQEVERLPLASWDVPLAAVVTEEGVICCDSALRPNFLAQDVLNSPGPEMQIGARGADFNFVGHP